tara:strand:+ start:907 stop:1317 length:411 start_codon:yes stop_codon:yes gene_type:complete
MKIIEINTSNINKESITKLLSSKICLIGVFSKLCIHCKNMKPQWKLLKKKLKNFNCNALLFEIDSNQLNHIGYNSLTKNVNGLPSIMVFKRGKLIKEYNGNRTSEDMFKFFKPYLVLVNNKTNKKLHKISNKTRKK